MTHSNAPLDKSFDPHAIENAWRGDREKRGDARPTFARGAPDFSLQLPPPNVTGTLHIGHAFEQTLMDSLARYHRMRGANTLWKPGTDHAGIATQLIVERQLEVQQLTRRALGREGFIKRVWAWKRHRVRRLRNRCGVWACRLTGTANTSQWMRRARKR